MWLSWPGQPPPRGQSETSTLIDVFGPDGTEAQVSVRVRDSQSLPDDDDTLSTVCAHLVARAVRAAYLRGRLRLLPPPAPVHHEMVIDLASVDALIASGQELPEMERPDERVPLGDIDFHDADGSWPLTLFALETQPSGDAILTLEVDAEHGPILTFGVRILREDLIARGVDPGAGCEARFWRAAGAVAVADIAETVQSGRVLVPTREVALEVELDLEEARRLSSDTRALAELRAACPTSWPAQALRGSA